MSAAETHAQRMDEQSDRDLALVERVARGRKFINSETGEVPGDKPVLDSEFERLAQLSILEYERQREAAAGRLGMRVAVLDKEVTKLRAPASDSQLQGAAVLFNEPEPWPAPVNGSELLGEVAQALADYLHLPAGAATVIALWIAAAHSFKNFQHAPRLNVTAATRGCGKTLALDVIATLVPRALRVENLTAAVLFRIVDGEQPALLVDEVDRHLRDNQELVGLLNSGFTRGGVALRCEGDKNEIRMFCVFAPVALSGIGELPGTLHDRSIVIRMERAKAGEVKRRFDSRHIGRETELKRKLLRWTADHAQQLAEVDPVMPAAAWNRVADLWRPLFAVAEGAGGDWPERAAKAFAKLQKADPDSEPVAVQLLHDAAAIMDEAKTHKMRSAELVEKLALLDDRPWATWNKGHQISPRQLAKLLSGFGIRPEPRKEGTNKVLRGYFRSDFIEPLARYVLSATPLQAAPDKGFHDSPSATDQNRVADEKSPEPAPPLGCSGVADKNPPASQEGTL